MVTIFGSQHPDRVGNFCTKLAGQFLAGSVHLPRSEAACRVRRHDVEGALWWPSSTGNAPNFDNLGKLAELYECAVADLLADLPDFRHRDTARSRQPTALTIPKPAAGLALPSAAGHSSVRLIERLEQARAGLQPWQHTAAVHTLDERLAAYGLA